jgi:DNA-binding CsgD family transcriptional regulator
VLNRFLFIEQSRLTRWLPAALDWWVFPRRRAAAAVIGAALVVSFLLAWLADGWLVQLALDHAARRANDEVQLGLLDRVGPADFATPVTQERLDDLADRLEPLLARLAQGSSAILRVNLITRDGTILYSDLASIRGRTIPPRDNAELRRALAGEVGADVETLTGEENADLGPRYGRAIEVYVPVRLDDQVVGAYEIYEELGALQTVRPLVWGGLVVLWSLVLIYLLALGLLSVEARPADQGPATIATPMVPNPANGLRDRRLRLTGRELEVLRLMATSHTNRAIAEQLVVSEETVRSHVKRILRKLGQPDRTQAVIAAVREGLLELPGGNFHPFG